ncbi:glycoside hydrolase family 88/105 protein [Jiulongibacter sp. NS-SX5]|uniref:glycoside hydrolase family 88/105 protein n=1 Tax=Jiulongibacter sp. NS-SX5 TaxID=3463854 RepID=UPI004059A08B
MNTLTKIALLLLIGINTTLAQRNVTNANDSNTPLHLLKPDYPVPYGIPAKEEVKNALDRILHYLEEATPYALENAQTHEKVTDYSKINEQTELLKGDFRIVSYEWGVTYGAMQNAAQVTGDQAYANYANERLKFIAEVTPFYAANAAKGTNWADQGPFRGLLNPHALDDCGAMCTAMIKAKLNGAKANFDPLIKTHIDYILNKEHRLSDGTLARNRPQPNTLWLDDMFMGLPAIAQMGKMTGDKKYYDEITKQIGLFAHKMFNKDRSIFMHGWVEGMEPHPEFHWGRANGWALLTLTEVLDVLPKSHPDYEHVLALYRDHAKGLLQYQSGSGFWHQLLDKSDSYLETSATAIYTYCFARGVNNGWLDAKAFTPAALLGWNATSTKITQKGQVDGTCVGTGMAFDPAFYYHRPISPYAAHAYGPAILAGSEVYKLLSDFNLEINDSSVQVLGRK